jgi:hypothetical protein
MNCHPDQRLQRQRQNLCRLSGTHMNFLLTHHSAVPPQFAQKQRDLGTPVRLRAGLSCSAPTARWVLDRCTPPAMRNSSSHADTSARAEGSAVRRNDGVVTDGMVSKEAYRALRLRVPRSAHGLLRAIAILAAQEFSVSSVLEGSRFSAQACRCKSLPEEGDASHQCPPLSSTWNLSASFELWRCHLDQGLQPARTDLRFRWMERERWNLSESAQRSFGSGARVGARSLRIIAIIAAPEVESVS